MGGRDTEVTAGTTPRPDRGRRLGAAAIRRDLAPPEPGQRGLASASNGASTRPARPVAAARAVQLLDRARRRAARRDRRRHRRHGARLRGAARPSTVDTAPRPAAAGRRRARRRPPGGDCSAAVRCRGRGGRRRPARASRRRPGAATCDARPTSPRRWPGSTATSAIPAALPALTTTGGLTAGAARSSARCATSPAPPGFARGGHPTLRRRSRRWRACVPTDGPGRARQPAGQGRRRDATVAGRGAAAGASAATSARAVPGRPCSSSGGCSDPVGDAARGGRSTALRAALGGADWRWRDPDGTRPPDPAADGRASRRRGCGSGTTGSIPTTAGRCADLLAVARRAWWRAAHRRRRAAPARPRARWSGTGSTPAAPCALRARSATRSGVAGELAPRRGRPPRPARTGRGRRAAARAVPAGRPAEGDRPVTAQPAGASTRR